MNDKKLQEKLITKLSKFELKCDAIGERTIRNAISSHIVAIHKLLKLGVRDDEQTFKLFDEYSDKITDGVDHFITKVEYWNK